MSGWARRSVLKSWSFSPRMRHQKYNSRQTQGKKYELCVNAHYLNPRLILKYGRNTEWHFLQLYLNLVKKDQNFPCAHQLTKEPHQGRKLSKRQKEKKGILCVDKNWTTGDYKHHERLTVFFMSSLSRIKKKKQQFYDIHCCLFFCLFLVLVCSFITDKVSFKDELIKITQPMIPSKLLSHENSDSIYFISVIRMRKAFTQQANTQSVYVVNTNGI